MGWGGAGRELPRPVANASNITAHERTLEQARSSTNNQLFIAFLDLIGKDEVASSKIGDASNRAPIGDLHFAIQKIIGSFPHP